ncbi:pentapeptide repeat-containing protein [Coleofasciculus sp. F4-SAH-05]|uniref:pentapeptide repeat-containing protein n=1 Tax=Coleofasciculus sp. F4-SAH-05 TaxID=3069525 RepID=UPI003302A5B1
MTNLPDPSPSNSTLQSTHPDPESEAVYRVSMTQFPERYPTTSKALADPALVTLCAIAVLIVGLVLDNNWVILAGVIVTLLLSLSVIWSPLQQWFQKSLSQEQRSQLIAVCGVSLAIVGIAALTGFTKAFDSVGSLAEWIGALGQILIAILAVYIAWRQYVISKDLTIQQNTITQQQTIDAYFQGICDLALDDEGLLEDWPQERAFCEGRTSAILNSIDAGGKAKVLRFLSQSKLLTPLKRDRHLGRPILDGYGGYQEDRVYGVRVIALNVMLAWADLAGTDLRWTELSEANMVQANLSHCDLAGANLSRTILYKANLSNSDLKGVRLFYGSVETASPRSRTEPPDYRTGIHTGAVVEGANFTEVQRLGEEQRHYCCSWCGEQSRRTIPGGCDGITNKLGR